MQSSFDMLTFPFLVSPQLWEELNLKEDEAAPFDKAVWFSVVIQRMFELIFFLTAGDKNRNRSVSKAEMMQGDIEVGGKSEEEAAAAASQVSQLLLPN